MSKIVLIAYKSEKDTDVAAILNARSALMGLPSTAILDRGRLPSLSQPFRAGTRATYAPSLSTTEPKARSAA